MLDAVASWADTVREDVREERDDHMAGSFEEIHLRGAERLLDELLDQLQDAREDVATVAVCGDCDRAVRGDHLPADGDPCPLCGSGTFEHFQRYAEDLEAVEVDP